MLYLQTLGDLRLEGGSGHLSSPRKQLALVAYLARHPRRRVSRAELADLLWGDREQGRARQSLRQALVELKRTFTDGLLVDADRVSITGGLRMDLLEFERDLAEGRREAAVERWGGDFLSGCEDLGSESFRTWLETEREALRRELAEACNQLVTDAVAVGEWERGIQWARCWVRWLPLEETAHRRLVECLREAGQIEAARASHGAFATVLRNAVGDTPSPQYEQLGAGLQLKARRVLPARSPGSAALFTPDLVGRSRAMAELCEGWARVLAGESTTILVEGEAGIGKTRLCEEFLRKLGSQPCRPVLLHARGYDPNGKVLGLLQQTIAELAVAPGIAAASPNALSELARLVPALRDRFPALPEPVGLPLEDALAEALTAVREESPLVLYVDDFPGADLESRRALVRLSRAMTAPILLLVTARTGEDEPCPEYVELGSRPGTRRLKLQLLRPGDVEALLGSMLELPAPARQRLARQLHDQASGNAFYIIELIAAMVDEGVLVPDEAGTWQITPASEDQHLPLPQSIRDVIARRLARLTPAARSVVNAAAVLGRTFDPAMLNALLEPDTAQSTVALESLMGRRILRPVPAGARLMEFTHELIWRVTYELLPGEERERLHRAAAAALGTKALWNTATKAAYTYHRRRAGRRLRRKWLAPAVGGVAAALLALILALLLTSPGQRASLRVLLTRNQPTLQARRIIVAPLTNHTGDSSLTSLGALASDWIAQGLMRTTQFEVVDPRTASITSRIVEGIPALLRDDNRAIAIAKETGSGTVVSGDLFRVGDTLRVLMQVIDVATGKMVRAVEPVLSSLTSPSQLVGLLGERVVTAVATALDTTSKGFSAALGTPPSYEAYTEVSRAWESFFHGDLPQVFTRLDRAYAIDTGYMTPLLMRAYVETRLNNWRAVDTLLQHLAAHQGTLTAAERAVYDVLRADLAGDLWARLRAARELMRLTPASVEGFTLTASSALFVNRPREALRTLEQVDPDRGLLLVAPFYYISHSPALHRLQEHRAELRSARTGLRKFPDQFVTHLNLLVALAAVGDVKGLRRELPRATRDDPSPGGPREKAFLVWRELRAHGQGDEAAKWLAEQVNQLPASIGDTTPEGALLEGDIHSANRRWAAATLAYTQGLSRRQLDPTLLGRLGVTAVHAGNRPEAERLDKILAQLSTPYLFGRHTYARARIQAALGNRAAAVELLRKAWKEGRPVVFDNFTYEDVHCDEEFESLRGYLPFQLLVQTD